VEEGDDNVNPGELAVSVTAVDAVGNESAPPFTDIDPSPTLSIDASRPVIISAVITSTDDDISVGETIDITVEADQTGYRNDDASTWINGVFVEPDHLTFTELGENRYLYSYTVQETDGGVARGELAIYIVLLDANPHSNASLPFEDLSSNNVQIETNRPSALISGPSDLCLGDSALITVLLGGTAPWTMDINDGSTITQHTTSVTPYTFYVSPVVSTDYTVDLVVDGTGNDNVGTGVASITVHELPDVQITNLQSIYDVTTLPVLLEYTPLGGTFTGPGISEDPWTFDPAAAGVSPEGSPHVIVYSYTDPVTLCVNSDVREVIVGSESGFIAFEKEDACFNDASFQITGSNVAGNIGRFTVTPTPPSGAFSDLGNDTAILRPDVYNLSANLTITVIYTFEDQTGTDIPISRELTKKNEQVVRGNLEEYRSIMEKVPLLGEFVIVIAGAGGRRREPAPEIHTMEDIFGYFKEKYGISRNRIKQVLMKRKE
jgi:hypothetical protein